MDFLLKLVKLLDIFIVYPNYILIEELVNTIIQFFLKKNKKTKLICDRSNMIINFGHSKR